ncbi:MAG: gamma-glutamyl-gamma-aminobutyrate hydrolase family protein [Burkholderiales bacterium]|nr:gamma-glutamyl-gamma-aminobutyrate hydrolase family protein [Burkholderiales bacterium]
MRRSEPPAAAAPPRHDLPLKIGLSARILHDPPAEMGFRNKKVLQYLEQSIAHWIMGQRALVFMVPTIESGSRLQRARVTMRDYVRELDGLVLQGGADVSPRSYGEEPLRPEWNGDRVRDLYEIDMLWEFVIQQKPVLGICRGAQLINVAFGGTLVQDIPTLAGGAIRHYDRDAYDEWSHEISIEPGSRLARLFPGVERANVTSIHHQAVKSIGNGLVVEAHAADGIIEAIRWTGSSHVVGLQWHPEFQQGIPQRFLDGAPVLLEFLEKARERRDAEPTPELKFAGKRSA